MTERSGQPRHAGWGHRSGAVCKCRVRGGATGRSDRYACGGAARTGCAWRDEPCAERAATTLEGPSREDEIDTSTTNKNKVHEHDVRFFREEEGRRRR